MGSVWIYEDFGVSLTNKLGVSTVGIYQDIAAARTHGNGVAPVRLDYYFVNAMINNH